MRQQAPTKVPQPIVLKVLRNLVELCEDDGVTEINVADLRIVVERIEAR